MSNLQLESGSARTAEELILLATRFSEFAVHVVEVCRTCSWRVPLGTCTLQ